ncbi:protein ORF49 [Cyprinid herpesvirus 1]|uniref:Protein ORF49 n=1 Tax=Cyprinid herpesvirus 1 TaxID=317858 RepID=K7PBC7_9VIRU|nr:protein ORF49 [Cyprinid herpesvirus 1]AFJ20349.1 protein ORF49 [Cyprinid herpesvirus 1]
MEEVYPIPVPLPCYSITETEDAPCLCDTLMRAVYRGPSYEAHPRLTWKLENGASFISETPWEEVCAQILRLVRGCAVYRLQPPPNLTYLLSWLSGQARVIPANARSLQYLTHLHSSMGAFSTFMRHKPKLTKVDSEAINIYYGIRKKPSATELEHARVYKDCYDLTNINIGSINGLVLHGVNRNISKLFQAVREEVELAGEEADDEAEDRRPIWHSLAVTLGQLLL